MDTLEAIPGLAEPILSDAAAAEPVVQQPNATAAAAENSGDAANEQTAVLPVIAGSSAASPVQAGGAAGEPGANTTGKSKDEPVKIGFKTFVTAEAALKYYYDLIKCLRREQDINEYEHNMVLDLLQRGHPAAVRKIGCGIASIQIMRHSEGEADCFHVIRTDGSREDFSVRKSIAGLFPVWAKANAHRPHPPANRGRGRGGIQRGGRGAARGAGRGPVRGRGRGGRGFRARGRARRGRGRG